MPATDTLPGKTRDGASLPRVRALTTRPATSWGRPFLLHRGPAWQPLNLSLHRLNVQVDHGVRGSRGAASCPASRQKRPRKASGTRLPRPAACSCCCPASRVLHTDSTGSFKNDTCKHLLNPKIKYSCGPSHEQRVEFCLLGPKIHRGVYRMKRDRWGCTHIRTHGSVPHSVWPRQPSTSRLRGRTHTQPRNDRLVVEPRLGLGWQEGTSEDG